MAVKIKYWVDITSRTAGAQEVAYKEPIGRFLTENTLAPMGKVMAFTDATKVGAHFGVNSKEYALAQKYFGFISKSYTSPKKLTFSRYTTSAVGAQIISGERITASVDDFKAITDGTLTITYKDPIQGIQTGSTTKIDLSSATSLGDVATKIQTAVKAIKVGTASNTPFSAATVTYASSGNLSQRFVLELPSGMGSFSAVSSNGGALAGLLGWDLASNVLLSDGNAGTNSLSEECERIMNANDSCYTFAFVETLTIEEYVEVAQWNEGRNSDFMFIVPVGSINDAITWGGTGDLKGTLSPYDGTWIQFDNLGENQYYQPMAATACMDLELDHSLINYEFQKFPDDTPVVDNDKNYEQLTSARVNFLVETGKNLKFLSGNACQGATTSATVYIGSVWLKDRIITKVMEAFLLNDAIYADKADTSKIAMICNNIWDLGKKNGVILTGKALSDGEKAAVEALTGDNKAYQTIESQGFIFTYSIKTDSETGKKYFNYRLIYAACDTIAKVEGLNIALSSLKGS